MSSGQRKTEELISKHVDDLRLTQHILAVEAAFPRYKIIAEDLLSDGTKVVSRDTFLRRAPGSIANIEPTGNTATAGLIVIYAVRDGRIVDHWMQFDLFTLLQLLMERYPFSRLEMLNP